MEAAIRKHAAVDEISKTSRSPFDPVIPLHVNTEEYVWYMGCPMKGLRYRRASKFSSRIFIHSSGTDQI